MSSRAPSATSSASGSSGHSSGGSGGGKPSYMNSPWRVYQLHQREDYPKEVWMFVASGIGFLILCNVIYLLRVRSRRNSLMRAFNSETAKVETEGSNGVAATPSHPNKPASWRRIPLAIDAAFKIVAFRWFVPFGRTYVLSFSELFFTLGYLGAILTWCFVHSHGGRDQNFWAQRAGAIASRQFPLLPLLSGKNNLIAMVTGLSYEKINVMHRAVARTLFILVLLHAFTKVESFTPDHLAQKKYLTGTMAAVAFGAIFLTSLRPVRTHAFEFFYIMHICLIAIFLAGNYFHQPEDAFYVWLFIGFWGFDRVLRVVRTYWINRGDYHKQSHAAIVYTICQDSIKLVLPNRHLTWKAGQHVYLVLPGVSNIPFESHPFTIANVPHRKENGEPLGGASDLVFYIRAMDGFTRKLYDYAHAHQGKTVVALVDGPYGRPPPINTFNTVVLIAGGSGSSFTVPLLLDIISAARRRKSPVKRVLFLWCVKHKDDLLWANDVIYTCLNTAPSTLDLDIRIHVTRANSLVPPLLSSPTVHAPPLSPITIEPPSPLDKSMFNEKVNDGSSEKGVKASRSEMVLTTVEEAVSSQSGHGHGIGLGIEGSIMAAAIHMGRPDIPAIIQEEIACSTGPISINACGPGQLTKAVRRGVRGGAAGPSAMLRGGASVSMHIENFGATRPGATK